MGSSTQTTAIRKRAVIVWAAAVAIYVVAVTGRTSFGVAGVDALDHFGVNASQLAVFTAVQVGVYACSQIPVGVLIDKFGPRTILIAGAIVMAIGQVILGLTSTYGIALGARVLIGAGDATAFLSVLRLIPTWFPVKKAPLFAQLTGGFGQMGQFLSAVPFLNLLHIAGWQAAFISLGATGLLVALLASVVLSDAPSDPRFHLPKRPRRSRRAQVASTVAGGVPETSVMATRPKRDALPMSTILKTITKDPIVWQAVFIHWTNMFPLGLFSLLWGVPLMTLGMGLDANQVGLALTILTITTVAFGPLHGYLSARFGRGRDTVAVILAVVQIAMVALFFVQPTPPSLVWLIILLVFQTLVIPAANYGFDTVRETVNIKVLASATGLANMGGFAAVMLSAQLLGFFLDHLSPTGDYTWDNFRLAWSAVFITWGIGYCFLLAFFLRTRKRHTNTHKVTTTVEGDLT